MGFIIQINFDESLKKITNKNTYDDRQRFKNLNHYKYFCYITTPRCPVWIKNCPPIEPIKSFVFQTSSIRRKIKHIFKRIFKINYKNLFNIEYKDISYSIDIFFTDEHNLKPTQEKKVISFTKIKSDFPNDYTFFPQQDLFIINKLYSGEGKKEKFEYSLYRRDSEILRTIYEEMFKFLLFRFFKE